jgi:integrase
MVPGERTKAGRALEYELNAEVTALLRRHIAEYRPRLPDSDRPYLFPGAGGGPRSKNALSNGICSAVRRHAGLEMNPHLFRHAIAKIAVEADPGAYLAVSRVLGHSTLETTMGHYLGTETKAAGRHVDRLLAEAKAKTPTLTRKSKGTR